MSRIVIIISRTGGHLHMPKHPSEVEISLIFFSYWNIFFNLTICFSVSAILIASVCSFSIAVSSVLFTISWYISIDNLSVFINYLLLMVLISAIYAHIFSIIFYGLAKTKRWWPPPIVKKSVQILRMVLLRQPLRKEHAGERRVQRKSRRV